MKNSLNTLTENKKNLEDLINEESLRIFDEKNWIGKDLRKIAEVTYSYDKKTGINTTLFVNGGGLDLKLYKKSKKKIKEQLLLKARKNLEKQINKKKEQITKALKKIDKFEMSSDSSIKTEIKNIFFNSLIEKENFLIYCLTALPFEVEKAGFKTILSKKEEEEIEKELHNLDFLLFGGDIKDSPEEVKLAYEYIYEIFEKNKYKLTIEEKSKFEEYLSKITIYLPTGYEYQQKKETKLIGGKFLDLDIPQSDYIPGFNIAVESLEKLEHIIESNKEVKSISDGPKGVHFPISKEFESMKIIRFLKLINHEIETHSITDYNSRKLIGNLRGYGSIEKDEGVAMLMEQLFMYGKELYIKDEKGNLIIDINKIQINSYFIKTLMGEVLNSEQLIDFLKLSNKIDPDIIAVKDRFKRLKRNNKDGVQHKDTTYTRGLLKAIKEINTFIQSNGKEGISPEDLFLGKISFSETNKLKNIKKSKEKSGKKIKILKPLFISDAVYFAITEKLEGLEGNITGDNFYNYIKDKYPIFNFTKEQINQVSYKTKRNVFGIVNILLKNIGEQQINNIFDTKNNTNKKLLNIIGNNYNTNIEKVIDKMDDNRKNAK